MVTDPILATGIMIVAGFFMGEASHRLKLPRITGYIIAGVLMSPSLLNVIAADTVSVLDILTPIALSVIAYSIGGSLHLPELAHLKKSIAWILPLQAGGTWLLVTLLLVLLGPLLLAPDGATISSYYLPAALVLGAIATATAPGAIIAIIREVKAKGSLTTTLLSIVALDDAIAILFFSIALGIAVPLAGGGAISLDQIILGPLAEIISSMGIGAAIGLGLVYTARLVRTKALLLVVVLGAVLLGAGITEALELSVILCNMAIGFVAANVSKRGELFIIINEIEDAIFALFFVLAGLHFNLDIIKTAGIAGVIIAVARFAGKYLGTAAGARLAGDPGVLRSHLGATLLPAAGVSVGLALLANEALPQLGAFILNATLASVIISEIIAPPIVEKAIISAGEAGADESDN